MSFHPTDITLCAEPQSIGSNRKLLRFSKLSEEQAQRQMQCRSKLRRSSLCSPRSIQASIGNTFLFAPGNANSTSCIIDPLNSMNSLHSLLVRSGSMKNLNMDDAVQLTEAWAANVDSSSINRRGSTQSQPSVPTQSNQLNPTTASHVETRTVSSLYVAAQEDYDDNYQLYQHSFDGDLPTGKDGDHYVATANSKDCVINVLYDDAVTKKAANKKSGSKQSISDMSSDSVVLESGYKSNNSSCTMTPMSREAEEVLSPATRCVELVSSTPTRMPPKVVKACISEVYPICRPYLPTASASGTDSVATSSADDSSEQISKLIVDLIGPDSRVGKLIFQSCSAEQDVDCIYEEIKQCVQAELQMEDKLASFFRKHISSTTAPPAISNSAVSMGAVAKYDSLQHIDDTLVFVKEHLKQIRSDFNEFKEHSYKKIDSKVSYTEFSDTTVVMRDKMIYLERKLFNEHRIMRQDIRNFREKINCLENEAACGLRNIPIWPFLAFIGTYSLINFGRR